MEIDTFIEERGASPTRNISLDQLKILIDFMSQHVDLATGSLRSLEARQTSKKLWNNLTILLNKTRFGSKKSTIGWSKYWSDFKNKLKRKVIASRKGITDKKVRPLTRLEKKALEILGPDFARTIPYPRLRQTTDPFNDVMATSLPEIKQETFLEESNGFSPSENQQSDAEKDNNISDSSNDGLEDFNDQVINSLYPKWLIEIEKKRAEAELIRAKAEAQKADVIAKNAQAALIQAESMKKLSEVAEVQAQSMLRIALALEGLVQNRNILEI